ncbi:hypothetical protein IT411_04230 [Candidatus Peregrinibacteria bacterium]|nr:hypothetical protein [Candidatus Peregrinibacteria bacterium]
MRLPTYREDPCISSPLEGPDIEVRPIRTAKAAKLIFRFPEGVTRLKGTERKVLLSKKKANVSTLERMFVGVVEGRDVYTLLQHVQAELHLPEGWAPTRPGKL